MTTRRAKVTAALVLVGVFLLGNMSGAGVALVAVRHRIQRVLQGPAEGLETQGLVFALDRELKLDNTQRSQIEQIHKRHLPELNRIRRESEAPLAAERARTAADIRAVLTPVQQTKFDDLYDRFESRRKRMLGAPPDRPW